MEEPSHGRSSSLGGRLSRLESTPPDTAVLTSVIWALRQALSASSALPIFLLVPPDVQVAILSSVTLRDRCRGLRAACKATRALIDRPEHWQALAVAKWATMNRIHPAPTVVALGARYLATNVHVDVVPRALAAATIVDVSARLVRWPSCIARLTTISRAAVATVSLPGAANGQLTAGTELHVGAPAHHPRDPHSLAVAVADADFPHLDLKASPGGHDPSACAPLPFATPALALGVPHGWALRLTAHFEVRLLSPPPALGAVTVGVLDERLMADLSAAPSTHSSAPSLTALLASRRANGKRGLYGVSVAVMESPATRSAEVAVNVVRPSTSGRAAQPALDPFNLAVGDVLGCTIDYASATVFWSHNGKRLDKSTCTLALAERIGWRPFAAVSGGSTRLRFSFGGDVGGGLTHQRELDADAQSAAATTPQVSSADPTACNVSSSSSSLAAAAALSSSSSSSPPPPARLRPSERFSFDVLAHEEQIWAELAASYSMKALFETMPNSTIDGTGSSLSGWPWSPVGSWQHTIEAHLEPWLALEAQHAKNGGWGRAPAHAQPPHAQAHAHAQPGSGEGERRRATDGPSGLRLFPSLEPLSVTAHDCEAYAGWSSNPGLLWHGAPLSCSLTGPRALALACHG